MTDQPSIRILGDASILKRPKVALFCSSKCPGKLILETYDLVKRFREDGVLVVSGFHSPMERECLRILLRSPQPVIWCLARGMYRRWPTEPVDCQASLADGRLHIVTPFSDTVRRVTRDTARVRNHLVADLAHAVFVAHAAPGSMIWLTVRAALERQQPVFTFPTGDNHALLEAGARPLASGMTIPVPIPIPASP